MNQEKYDLIMAGKHRQVTLMEKIDYWKVERRKANYFIRRYRKELEKQKIKDNQ